MTLRAAKAATVTLKKLQEAYTAGVVYSTPRCLGTLDSRVPPEEEAARCLPNPPWAKGTARHPGISPVSGLRVAHAEGRRGGHQQAAPWTGPVAEGLFEDALPQPPNQHQQMTCQSPDGSLTGVLTTSIQLLSLMIC
ncbi:hypothetical protein E2C01_054620 [Portunus trituberculatus]|uniref:Uncharacterized protein n=1 Tax=Portunus trituberculatus TaxID=210409 RepID=A0A5B7GU79_PORTR|nr:hypothetical protein [Portunus trituberculatus]